VKPTVDTLFDDYAARWARGERPDAADYLERAGWQREELALLIDRYLAVAPALEPDESALAFAERLAAGDPPLLAARVARGLKVQALVDRIVKAFSLPADKDRKVSAYWHELESGRRRPADVAPELWDKVVELLGPAAEAARGWSPPPLLATDVKYSRVRDETFLSEEPAPAPAVEEGSQTDEVDLLFGYGH
jgi:hypothetical protein